ncbi:unnamed protein product [Heligmosomoides polygyrus]|uniref:Peptidyl-prolyl cis-trans isomerase n=1 Tax=Heligmosomoides polygyrus TaxID=6339 RepID=A0A183FRN7_HELPZ|nr:unnamed protein product [Heligmosomoides polygyrus]
MAVLVETTLGDIVIDVYVKERPKCSLNFIKLCKMKYYNLCQFHTIEQNYIAQTGDPTGTGRGGESIFMNLYGEQARYFEREDLPKMKHTRMGVVSFVNNGDNMLGSQFFITLGENLDYLDDKHTIFGQVTEGLDTLEKLNDQLCDGDHKPYRDIRIAHTIVLDDPFEDPPRIKYPSRSPSPTFEMLVQTNKIALDENIDDYEGKTAEEVAEEIKKRDMAEQAQILEMIGDLRHADEAPPDNVLFVCKLNPVTTDEDLEIIFSRFGKIIKCEVIRDRRSQQSLQYAFIEFDDPKACEQAFFKMDNVLIDDRRIHVDFSQSVPPRSYKPKDASPKRNGGGERREDKRSPERRGSPERRKDRIPERKRRERSRSRDLPQKFRRDRSAEKVSRRRSRSASRDRGRDRRDKHNGKPREKDRRERDRSGSRERWQRRRSRSRSATPEKKRARSSERKRSVSPGRKKHRR